MGEERKRERAEGVEYKHKEIKADAWQEEQRLERFPHNFKGVNSTSLKLEMSSTEPSPTPKRSNTRLNAFPHSTGTGLRKERKEIPPLPGWGSDLVLVKGGSDLGNSLRTAIREVQKAGT